MEAIDITIPRIIENSSSHLDASFLQFSIFFHGQGAFIFIAMNTKQMKQIKPISNLM